MVADFPRYKTKGKLKSDYGMGSKDFDRLSRLLEVIDRLMINLSDNPTLIRKTVDAIHQLYRPMRPMQDSKDQQSYDNAFKAFRARANNLMHNFAVYASQGQHEQIVIPIDFYEDLSDLLNSIMSARQYTGLAFWASRRESGSKSSQIKKAF